MKLIAMTVQGVSPLLFNRMTEEALLGLRIRKRKAKSLASVEETPRQQAERALYLDDKGPYLPQEMLMSCLVRGGMYARLDGKRQMSTAQSSVVPGFLDIREPRFYITPPEWEVDLRQGRNPNGGEAVCLIRPRFDKWEFTATLRIDTEQVTEQQIRELADISLMRCGLGDFRPARKGPFGRSVVRCWETVAADVPLVEITKA
jgi:hypothetical protein